MRHALATILDSTPERVRHCGLPTPFPVGDVNCWLLAERPVTLIDPGMMIPASLRRVEDFLAEDGLALTDVDQIVVTHGHPDHFGAAGWLAERSGAPIVAGRPELRRLLPMPESYPSVMRRLMADLGVPDSVRDAMSSGVGVIRQLVQSPTVEQLELVDDAAELEAGGRKFAVHLTPGHSVGHISLFCETDRTLFSGDHLLPRITPNPMLELNEDAAAPILQALLADDVPMDEESLDAALAGIAIERRRSLVEYLDSLERFVELDPMSVLPGHDRAFNDVPELVRNMREHHRVRADEIADKIAALGAPTPYELALALFPDLSGMNVMLGISEACGHADILVDDGRVEHISEVPIRFRAV